MDIDKREFPPLLLIVLMLLMGVILYQRVPDLTPTRWNAWGNVTGYGSRNEILFLIPVISIITYVAISIIPRIAVMKMNMMLFSEYLYRIKSAILLFLFGLYLTAVLNSLGYRFNMNYYVVPSAALLLYYFGWILQYAKRNYFIGIKTPWTLADDRVWERTHRIGSITLRINAAVLLFALLFPTAGFIIFSLPITLNFIFFWAYSWWEYQRVVVKSGG